MSRDMRVFPSAPAAGGGDIPTLFCNDGNGASASANARAQRGALQAVGPPRRQGALDANSSQPLPASLLVRPPIGDIEALRLALAPARARGSDRVGILAINDEHDALISVGIGGHRRAVDQEAHRRAVRVIAVEREQDRLLARLSLAPSTVREEAVVAEGPQMRVECLD